MSGISAPGLSRSETLPHYSNALLEANDRPKYEMWRSVYANMLSRWQLYVQQAEILQMHFGYLSEPAAQPERGRAMSMSTRLRLPDQGVKKTICA